MSLSEKQIRHLKGLAHHLKPVVWLGQHGLRESVLEEIRVALASHELIKVKIPAEKTDRLHMIAEISAATGADSVQHIGQMAVFFLRNPKKPKIVLPSK